jgi:hypothetical protein
MNSKTLMGTALRALMLCALAMAGTAQAADAELAYISPGICALISTWWSTFW